MDRMEDEYAPSLSTKGDIGTFALEEINGSASNELQRQTSMKLFSFFNRT